MNKKWFLSIEWLQNKGAFIQITIEFVIDFRIKEVYKCFFRQIPQMLRYKWSKYLSRLMGYCYV